MPMKVVFDTNIIIDHLKGMPQAREQLKCIVLPMALILWMPLLQQQHM